MMKTGAVILGHKREMNLAYCPTHRDTWCQRKRQALQHGASRSKGLCLLLGSSQLLRCGLCKGRQVGGSLMIQWGRLTRQQMVNQPIQQNPMFSQ